MDVPQTSRTLARRTAVVAGVIALVAVLVVAIVLAAEIFLVLFAGVLFAILLRGMADVLSSRTRLSPGISLAVVVVALLAVTALAGFLLAPPVAEQIRDLVRTLPEKLRAAEQRIAALPGGARVVEPLHSMVNGEGGGEPSVDTITMPFRVLVDLVVFLVSGLYLAAQPKPYIDGAVRLVPPARRERFHEVLLEVGGTLRRFLVGRLVSMIGVGVLTGIGLTILGVPMAAALAVIAGVLTFVPYAGPIAASVPIAVVALATDSRTFVYTMVLYTVVQCIEGFVITPLVQKKAVALLPVVTLGSEVLLGWFFGPIGIIVSVPLAAATIVLVKRLYVEDILEARAA
jgi:predicted PurR-regulated permease PerM